MNHAERYRQTMVKNVLFVNEVLIIIIEIDAGNMAPSGSPRQKFNKGMIWGPFRRGECQCLPEWE